MGLQVWAAAAPHPMPARKGVTASITRVMSQPLVKAAAGEGSGHKVGSGDTT